MGAAGVPLMSCPGWAGVSVSPATVRMGWAVVGIRDPITRGQSESKPEAGKLGAKPCPPLQPWGPRQAWRPRARPHPGPLVRALTATCSFTRVSSRPFPPALVLPAGPRSALTPFVCVQSCSVVRPTRG